MKTIMYLSVFSLCFQSNLLWAKKSHWNGIRIAEEVRCTPFKRSRDYPYSQSIEQRIVKSMGNRIYCPYSGRFFNSIRETDIEHIVSLSEAHDSGLCAADAKTKKKFSSDIRNLTLAEPSVNRYVKKGHDASKWMPENNKCWYVKKIVEVKKLYNLSVDLKEMEALQKTLSQCSSFSMIFFKKNNTKKLSYTKPSLPSGSRVKKSKSGICHAKNFSSYYGRVKNFTSYPSLKSCLDSGGRCPKNDFQCQSESVGRSGASVE